MLCESCYCNKLLLIFHVILRINEWRGSLNAETEGSDEIENEEDNDQSARDSCDAPYSTIDITTTECVAYHSNFSETAVGDSTVIYDRP